MNSELRSLRAEVSDLRDELELLRSEVSRLRRSLADIRLGVGACEPVAEYSGESEDSYSVVSEYPASSVPRRRDRLLHRQICGWTSSWTKWTREGAFGISPLGGHQGLRWSDLLASEGCEELEQRQDPGEERTGLRRLDLRRLCFGKRRKKSDCGGRP